jgi:AraC-like DNA-binding protein
LLHLRRRVRDPLFVDETVLGMFRGILRRSRTCSTSDAAHRVTLRHRRLVDDAKVLLTLWATRRVLLAELSKELRCSAFHLCHLFRSVEGMTMHEYQTQLRLRAAVQCLLECRSKDLAQLAIELGFCSHSHFSAVFRRTFGTAPSSFVKQLSATDRPTE